MHLIPALLPNVATKTIKTTRIFTKPIDKVYKAWTDPRHLGNWWGPRGFTNSIEVFDLKPGGEWKFTMHGPDGKSYLNECEFVHIAPYDRIAWNHHSHPRFQVQVDLEEITPERTLVQYQMIFLDEHTCSSMRSFVTEKNEENLDKLEAELAMI